MNRVFIKRCSTGGVAHFTGIDGNFPKRKRPRKESMAICLVPRDIKTQGLGKGGLHARL